MKTLEQQWPKHKIFINHCLKIDQKKTGLSVIKKLVYSHTCRRLATVNE